MHKNFKAIAMIPARYQASRFPGKLMQDLAGKTVIVRTYEAAKSTQLFDEVYVVTDSEIIFSEIEKEGGKAIMSQKEHDCGSDRIAEAVQDMEVDIVVNVQGDEPFINEKALSLLLKEFENDTEGLIDLASLKVKLTGEEDIQNPNHVKVITDLRNFALYFSRSPIPFHRAKDITVDYFKHVGIYAFRKKALMDFYKLPMSPLEAAEKIECIRYLENGKTIKMVETSEVSIGIDTPEDLEKARQKFS
ncbi:3-deoxy-manno-octulosonate cytidylyltransferase KdsB [Psychroflexus gondwanensis ACAM 44]|jgi:3-deoxy-D-manno-octulosonate cytidylyltransferase|uniref:3-deoxy-manno-octulosonate cytidylyltransferase n=1 Tax=Psychroflexus gondwanensis ACAM 44 TaxID=1189619 RepID=N1WYD5_9FLAO|nr:3-deoxy-manno-octulosonate cytidylyltransferase [Psychroflexus gondwanensis]EMY82114.1 3-deoxy-manno-octulosonate cytidylyltransferase KdsB [Psychroflexus gondwanensis ACAM 44]